RCEQVAQSVERECYREANARGDDLALAKIGRDLLDRAVFILQIECGPTRAVNLISVRVVGRSQPEINVSGGVEGDSQGIDTVRQLLPSAGDHFLGVGLAIAINVEDQGDLSFRGDENAVAGRIAWGRKRHADRGHETAVVFPEMLDFFLDTI